MNIPEGTVFIYPGQPFIGEAMIQLLLAFNNEPRDDARPSILECEHSKLSIASTMIALEGIVKIKLHETDIPEPRGVEDLFLCTLDKFTKNHKALNLWIELKILRNQIIHSAYFESSIEGKPISKATLKGLNSKYYAEHLCLPDERTKRWRLKINPLAVSRYEALVALLFFYWYGRETGVWKSNNPLHAPFVDSRMKYGIRDNWISIGEYNHLLGHGSDFVRLIGYLSGRLSATHQEAFYRLSRETLNLDIESKYRSSVSILKMFKNMKVTFGGKST